MCYIVGMSKLPDQSKDEEFWTGENNDDDSDE